MFLKIFLVVFLMALPDMAFSQNNIPAVNNQRPQTTGTANMRQPGPLAGNGPLDIQVPASLSSAQPGAPGNGSGKQAAEKDIRDIKGPIKVANPWLWAYWVLGILAFLLIAYVIFRMIRRVKEEKKKLAHEIALEKLEKAKVYIKAGKAEKYSMAVTCAVRPYVEDRFKMRMTRSTTEEFFRELKEGADGPLSEYSDVLRVFLENCDLAKFACYGLSEDEMLEMHHNAWVFVEETMPHENNNGTGHKKGNAP